MNNITEVIHGHISAHVLEQEGFFPNNPHLPLLVYKGALRLHPDEEPESIFKLFEKNGWKNGWKGGIYNYHHYHSTSHEVLAVFCGTVDVVLGGEHGVCVELTRGDVLVIPAGVAHRNIKSSDDFLCVGAYPAGSSYDELRGTEDELPKALQNIAGVAIPNLDPVLGEDGPLQEHWMKVSTGG